MNYDSWLNGHTPGKWQLAVSAADGGRPAVRIPAPDDRDVRACIADVLGAGEWRVEPIMRAQGKSAALERARLGLAEREQIDPQTIMIDEPDDEDIGDGDEQVPQAVQDAQHAALVAEAEARTASARATQAQHERARAEAEAAARQFRVGGEQQRTEIADVLRAMLEQQQRADARMDRVLESLREHRGAPPPGEPLERLRETLGLVSAVRELVASDTQAPAEGWAGILREARMILPEIVAIRRGAVAKQNPEQTPTQTPQAPTKALQALPQSLARERVLAFVRGLAQEIACGSEPGTVADQLGDSIGLLPASMRGRLDEGDWPGAWTAAKEYLDADERAQVEQLLGDDVVREWLTDFATALRVSDDPGTGTAIAEG